MKTEKKGLVKNRYFGIGMEKLDRDAFDPTFVYDAVDELGVKRVRLQSGWAKTETEKGKYSFAWLDTIVDNLVMRGISPWICLCYGNPLYDEEAKKYAGGVGCPPIRTEEAYTAWLTYCKKVAERYKDKVELYEVWNEPEWLWYPKQNAKEYAEFCRKTSRSIKEGNPNAKIIIGATSEKFLSFPNAILAEGAWEGAEYFSYHSYSYDEKIFLQTAQAYRALFAKYGCDLRLIHGECGSQSKSGGNGAYVGVRVSERMQAKQLLRQTTADRLSNVCFSSYFSAVDMHENLQAKAGKPIRKRGYFGVLKTEFDKKTGVSGGAFIKKPSFYAFRNVCEFLSEDAEIVSIPCFVEQCAEYKTKDMIFHALKKVFVRRLGAFWHDDRVNNILWGCFKKGNAYAVVYWYSSDLLKKKERNGKMNFQVAVCGKNPYLYDLMTGEKKKVRYSEEKSLFRFENLPIRDYPTAIVFEEYPKE